ncbi:type I secretion system permease/ATPase [Ramlibacter sp. 2FC]|uniref:type I secretion system permease/ATPase n=1 Tax=Ramlibacter sp. 2FC TaxID=2502188 RepID=UPI0010F9DA3A|nr:type I secretion system permease/ATPase [Ramlibacter sp. 2FC]
MKPADFTARSELGTTLWAFRREFLVVGVFSMVSNLLLLAPTIYLLQVYDRVLVSRSELTLLAVSLVTLFLIAVLAFAEWSRSRLLVRTGMRLDQQLGTRVFGASFEASLSQAGGNPARALRDMTEIRQFLTGHGVFAFFDAPWTPIYLAVLFFLHPWLGLLALGFMVIQAALAWFGQRHSLAPNEAAAQALSEAQSFLQSKLRNAELLESMGMVGHLRQRWQARHAAYLARQARAQGLTHRLVAWSKLLRYSQQSLVLGAGALLVIDGQLSPGGMIAANVLTLRALAPIDLLVGSWRGFAGAHAAYQRLEALLAAHPERGFEPSLQEPTGALTLRDVVASAAGRAKPILDGLSFAAEPGTLTMVMGPSGSGKSTLARVMLGIWPDVTGEVLLDGRPVTEWDRTTLGPHLGYLPQDIELMEGTIGENIARFGELDSAKVIAAARSAGLHEMILRFPKGYDTPVGEAGNLLSGGLRQRVALARALYGEPALVVLDEPNANLDDAGEAALQKALQELKAKGRTVFVIAHRPLLKPDRLLLLHEGRLVADGTPETIRAMARPARPLTVQTAPGPHPPAPGQPASPALEM